MKEPVDLARYFTAANNVSQSESALGTLHALYSGCLLFSSPPDQQTLISGSQRTWRCAMLTFVMRVLTTAHLCFAIGLSPHAIPTMGFCAPEEMRIIHLHSRFVDPRLWPASHLYDPVRQ